MVAVDFWSCELCKSTERQNIQAMRILNEIFAIKSLSFALFLETTSQPTPSSLAIYVWKNRSQNARLWMCHRRRRRHGKIREVPWCQLTSHNSMAIINSFDSLRSPIWIHLSNCTQRHLIALRLFTSIRFLRIFNIFFSLSVLFFFTSFFFSFTFFHSWKTRIFTHFPTLFRYDLLWHNLPVLLDDACGYLQTSIDNLRLLDHWKSLAQTSIVRYFLIHLQVKFVGWNLTWIVRCVESNLHC